jgi:hypothetical protein
MPLVLCTRNGPRRPRVVSAARACCCADGWSGLVRCVTGDLGWLAQLDGVRDLLYTLHVVCCMLYCVRRGRRRAADKRTNNVNKRTNNTNNHTNNANKRTNNASKRARGRSTA